MNPALVFARTAEGERLARSPRQIGSYGHRATLLLVDGQITVGELERRFGASLPIETVLGELESDGLIVPKAGMEVVEAEQEAAHVEDVVAPGLELELVFDPAAEHLAQGRPQHPAEEALPELPVVRAQDARVQEDTAAPAILPPVTSPAVVPVAVSPDDRREEPAAPRRKPERAWQLSSAALVRNLGPRAWWMGGTVLVAALVAAIVVWLSGLRPSVEARASQALGVPVVVGSLGLAFHHGPALTLHDVSIGLDAPLVLPRVDVMPDPRRGNVWSSCKVLILRATLKPSELESLAGLLGSNTVVTEVAFSELGLSLGALRAGTLAGSLEITPGGAVFKLADPAGGLTLEARPNGPGLETFLTATPGTLPLLGHPPVGTVELHGLLEDGGLTSAEIGMTGYGGKFEGSVSMRWEGPVSVDAHLRMVAVSLSQLAHSLFGRVGFAEGQAAGTLALEARAPSWEELVRIDRITGNFLVERGAFKGFDLGSALRERSPRPVSGGETRFDSLRGRLEAGPREIRLWLDRLEAGALSASGVLTVTGFEGLRGNLSAAVQVPGRGVVRYPAQLSGTVALPAIQLVLPGSGEKATIAPLAAAESGDNGGASTEDPREQ